jgi:hypothetical protein
MKIKFFLDPSVGKEEDSVSLEILARFENVKTDQELELWLKSASEMKFLQPVSSMYYNSNNLMTNFLD